MYPFKNYKSEISGSFSFLATPWYQGVKTDMDFHVLGHYFISQFIVSFWGFLCDVVLGMSLTEPPSR